MSPTPYSLVSSWAWYFFDRRTVFFSTGWVKRRSTRTTTVLSCLSLTTVPWSTRLGIRASSLRRLFGGALLARDRVDPRDIPPHLADARGVFQLTGRPLEAQIKPLLFQFQELVAELIEGHGPHLVDFHRCFLK